VTGPEQALLINTDAEAAVIGSMLISRDAVQEAVISLKEEMFTVEEHRIFFRCMVELEARNIEVDPVSVSEWLRTQGLLERAGGANKMFDLANSVATGANIGHYTELVTEKYMRRSVLTECSAIMNLAKGDCETDAIRILDEAEIRINGIRDSKQRERVVTVGAVVGTVLNTMDRRLAGEWQGGIDTGLIDLDRKLGGLNNTDSIIVAGRTSMGKTAFALTVALEAVKSGHPVVIFSLEMSKEQLTQRLLCSVSGVDLAALRAGQVGQADVERLNNAANLLYDLPLMIDDTPAMTAQAIRIESIRLKRKKNIGLVIVDYLQLIGDSAGNRNGTRTEKVSADSRAMKALAKELNVPVITLSQLSREVDRRDDQVPQLADLRESGAIEQDADVVLFVYRPEVAGIVEREGEPTNGIADIMIAKNRNGKAPETARVFFKKETTTFTNLSRREAWE